MVRIRPPAPLAASATVDLTDPSPPLPGGQEEGEEEGGRGREEGEEREEGREEGEEAKGRDPRGDRRARGSRGGGAQDRARAHRRGGGGASANRSGEQSDIGPGVRENSRRGRDQGCRARGSDAVPGRATRGARGAQSGGEGCVRVGATPRDERAAGPATGEGD
eukprot:31532-Pelagococcus_subviridis.AAC.27